MNAEASRCLLCKKPKCSEACPVHTDVPSAMKLYREGNLTDAAKMLFENNPLSAITSQVCDWQIFCKGHCVLNARKMPVRWYEIEQEISMSYLPEAHIEIDVPDNGKKVAVIGAGPCGIAASMWLRKKGVSVTLYDSFDRVGGVLRYGIPDFRLDKKYVDAYERILNEIGVVFVGNTTLGKEITIESLRKEFDAIVVAAGAWVAKEMRIPGEDLPGVLHALEFLKEPSAYELGKNVIVIGGGNVAMDACRTAIRRGCDTTVVYRKTFENMPANHLEVEEAQAEGVKFRVFEVPVEVRKDGDRVYAILRNCENYETEDGKINTRVIEGTDHELDFDTMIVAVSEKADKSILDGYDHDENPDIFKAGDYFYGPRTVVEAVQSAKLAVADMISYLQV